MHKQVSIPWAAAPLSDGPPFDARSEMHAKCDLQTAVNLAASSASPIGSLTERRPLDVIANELNSVLKREVADVIKIGGLLVEAKAQLSHGQWLPWLANNFPLSKSTVANYINAYKFAVQFPTIGNLKIHPSALYLLASRAFNIEEAVDVLKAAETQWVGSATVCKIRLRTGSSEPLCAPRAPDIGDKSKPSSGSQKMRSTRHDAFFRENFRAAVLELEKLRMDQSEKFVGIIPSGRLRTVINFLRQVEAASCKAA
jgi:Protein of unknown function (DUF3102)